MDQFNEYIKYLEARIEEQQCLGDSNANMAYWEGGKESQIVADLEMAKHYHSKQYDLKTRIQQELTDCDPEKDQGKIEAFSLILGLI